MNVNKTVNGIDLINSEDLSKYLILVKSKFYIRFYNEILSNSQLLLKQSNMDEISIWEDVFKSIFKQI